LLFRHIRDFFQKRRERNEEHPELIMHAYIESGSEKLREFANTVKRVQSEWLTMQERIVRLEAEVDMNRKRAEAALEASEEEQARGWLTQAHAKQTVLAELQSEANQKKAFADELQQQLDLMADKIRTAKDMKDHYLRRNRHALSSIEANKAMPGSSSAADAMDAIQEKTFLAEAKAELAQSRLPWDRFPIHKS
jgi:phage shock protein A